MGLGQIYGPNNELIMSLSKGVEEQVIYSKKWTIRSLFAEKLVVPNLSYNT